jgi:hypothetical protein
MKSILTIIINLLVATNITAQQGGSFFLADIKELLDQQRGLWESVQAGFDIYSVGDAGRISSAENRNLAGIRRGPYQLWAKPKNLSGAFIFRIDIETETSFLDESDATVTIKRASKLRERILAIKISPLPPAEYFKPPPD